MPSQPEFSPPTMNTIDTTKPVASMWQHVETGDTRIIQVGSIATISGHFRLIGTLYLHPAEQATNHPEQMLDMVQPDAEPSVQEPVMINGLTEAETSASASVFGLVRRTATQPAAAPDHVEDLRGMVDPAAPRAQKPMRVEGGRVVANYDETRGYRFGAPKPAAAPTVADVLAAEREACAKLCDSYAKHLRAFAYDSMAAAAESCAESIRARTE